MSETGKLRIMDSIKKKGKGAFMIRFLFGGTFLVLFLVLGSPLLLIEVLVGKINRRARDISSLRIVQWGFRVILWFSGAKVTTIGMEKIPKDQPVLYVANHRSYFDILLISVRNHDLTGFVAKKEMDKFPILNIWMRYIYCLFLDRENIREGMKTILQAIENVKNGISMVIFPEGTRNKVDNDLDMLPFHDASFKIAQRSGCAVVPIAINNSSDIFENHIPKLKPCKVVMEYCDPIIISGLPKEDQKHLGRYTQGIILEKLKKNQELVR